MRILKFGGTSVATPARRAEVARIVRQTQRHSRVVVVTSALAGVTRLLQQAIADAVAGQRPHQLMAELRARHLQELSGASSALAARRRLAGSLAELEALLTGIALLGECPPGARHRCLAAGERLALPLVMTALEEAGVRVVGIDGTELLVATAEDRTELDLQASQQRTRSRWRRLSGNDVALVTGFVADDAHGGTTTLGRGASDLTATVLASALDAEAVEIWSDVDGILAAPPRWIPDARPLPALSYSEATALARYGAEVLHPAALGPVAEIGIPVWVRNTLNPQAVGTRIDDRGAVQGDIRAVTVCDGQWDGQDAAIVAVIGHGWPHGEDAISTALQHAGITPLTRIATEASATTTVVTKAIVARDQGQRALEVLYENPHPNPLPAHPIQRENRPSRPLTPIPSPTRSHPTGRGAPPPIPAKLSG